MSDLPVLDPAPALVVRLALALLLAGAAWHKLRSLGAFRQVLSDYRLLPASWTGAVARGIPLAETATGVGLALRWGAAPALAAAGLFGLYGVAIAVNLARGRRSIDCGCGGPAGGQPLSWALVLRNGGLVVAALLAALPVGVRGLVWIDALTISGGIAGFALVHAAVDVAIANASRLRAAEVGAA